jgi:hypothetical protein
LIGERRLARTVSIDRPTLRLNPKQDFRSSAFL